MPSQNKLIFITELQDSTVNGSSTQVVSDLYLEGFLALGKEVHLIGVVDPIENLENIKTRYNGLVESLTIVESELFLRGVSGNLARLFTLYKFSLLKTIFPGSWRKLNYPIDAQVIFSCCPSIEISLLSTFLKKDNPKIKNIQLWSDPVFWSGGNPYELNLKKLTLYPLEAMIYLLADRIIFQSPVMLKIQRSLFPFVKFNGYVHPPANPKLGGDGPKSQKLVAYVGNANPKVRDLANFVSAARDMSDTQFLIIANDFDIESSKNIQTTSARISSEDAFEYEKTASVLVVLLNHTTPQIPGKVYFYIGAGVPVLVIVDGPFGLEIRQDLEKYSQLYFCKNERADIFAMLSQLTEKNTENKIALNHPKTICGEILNVH